MASNSPMARQLRCFYCLSIPPALYVGWRLSCGDYAALCFPCSYTYYNGTFCEIFHRKEEGWRPCSDCGKGVHCGCIMSMQHYVMLDTSGVQCMKCFKKELERSRISQPSSSAQPTHIDMD